MGERRLCQPFPRGPTHGVTPPEQLPFCQEEQSGSRFNREPLKSQTRCRHRQVGTGRGVVARPWGPAGIPAGVRGCRGSWAGSRSPPAFGARQEGPCQAPTSLRLPPGHRCAQTGGCTPLLPPWLDLGTPGDTRLSPPRVRVPEGCTAFLPDGENPVEERDPSSPLHPGASRGRRENLLGRSCGAAVLHTLLPAQEPGGRARGRDQPGAEQGPWQERGRTHPLGVRSTSPEGCRPQEAFPGGFRAARGAGPITRL